MPTHAALAVGSRAQHRLSTARELAEGPLLGPASTCFARLGELGFHACRRRPGCMSVAAYLAPGACWQPPSIYWTAVHNARSPASRLLPPIPCGTGQRSGRGGVAKRRPPEHRSVDNLSHTTAMTRSPTARRRRRHARPQADKWQGAGVLPEGSAGPQLCGRRRAQVRDASLEKLPAADWLLPSTSCAAPGAVSLGQWARPCCPQPTP